MQDCSELWGHIYNGLNYCTGGRETGQSMKSVSFATPMTSAIAAPIKKKQAAAYSSTRFPTYLSKWVTAQADSRRPCETAAQKQTGAISDPQQRIQSLIVSAISSQSRRVAAVTQAAPWSLWWYQGHPQKCAEMCPYDSLWQLIWKLSGAWWFTVDST